MGSTHSSSNRLVGDTVIVSNFAQWFLVLNNATQDRRPLLRRNLIARFGGAWMSMAHRWQWGWTCAMELGLEHLLELLIEETGGGMEVN